MTTTANALNLEQLVADVYATTSPSTESRRVVSLALVTAANQLDVSGITTESLDRVIKLAKVHQELDGHNWCHYDRALNEGVIDVARYLKSVVAEKIGA